MITQSFPMILAIVLGLVCIQNAVGEIFSNPNWIAPSYIPHGPDAYGYPEVIPASFPDILFNQLISSNDFQSIFSRPITGDLAVKIGLAIAQSLVGELGLQDSYLATNLLTDALMSIDTGAGPEAYGRALSNVINQLVLTNDILSRDNYANLANILTRVIVDAVPAPVVGDIGFGLGSNIGASVDVGAGLDIISESNAEGYFNPLNPPTFGGFGGFGLDFGGQTYGGFVGVGGNLDAGLEIDDNLEIDLGLNANVGLGINAGLGAATNLGLDIDAGLGLEAGAGLGLEVGTGLGLEAGAGLGLEVGTGLGLEAGAGLGLEFGTGLGLEGSTGLGLEVGTGLGFEFGAGLGLEFGTGLNLEVGAGLDFGIDAGLYLGIDAGLDIGADVDVGLDIEADIDIGANLGIVTDLDADAEVGVEANVEVGADVNVEANVGIGVKAELDVDLSISVEAINLFKKGLFRELLRDKYFRYAFSNYVSISAFQLIAASLVEHLSEAFSLSRSYLMPLERKIAYLSSDLTPSAELYAGIIANTLTDLLRNINLIATDTSVLQITIAARAISSGLKNFLRISAVPGLGLDVSSNTYNSYFSVLSGLEKLPYVGIDAVSQKLPIAVKTAQASTFAIRFAKTLYYYLVSSSRFMEVFSISIPTIGYKILANYLGNSMAEAFGSPSPSVFIDIYNKALLANGNKLNYKSYAKTFSLATTKALYLLGYFLSGNVNVQAAIAKNALIRALRLKSSIGVVPSLVVLYPANIGIPWTTSVSGVEPPDSLVNVGVGVGLGLGIGVEADIGANVELGVEAGVVVDAEVGVDAETGVEIGLELDAGVDLEVDFGLGFDAGVDLGGDVGLEFDAGVDLGLDVELGFDAGVDLGVNLGLGVDVGFDSVVDLGVGLGADIGFGRGVEAEAEVDADVGLEIDAGFGVGVDLGVGFGADTGFGLGVDAGFGVGVDASLGIGTGFELGGSLGLGTDIEAGLGFGVGTGNRDLDWARDWDYRYRPYRKKRHIDLDSLEMDDFSFDLDVELEADVSLEVDVGLNANVEVDAGVDVEADAGVEVRGHNLSILKVLPEILKRRFCQSIALYTSINLVGYRKVINLFAQSIAAQYGFAVASVFLKSYSNNVGDAQENSIGLSTEALAIAITDALAAAGILNTTFCILTVDQLAVAIVAKFSSLIATSLDAGGGNIRPIWSYLLRQNLSKPPLSRGYCPFCLYK